MPLMSPKQLNEVQIHNVLRESGIKPKIQQSLKASLEASSLSLDDALCELGTIVRCAESDGVKLSAIKTVLEMHGALAEKSAVSIPVINIVINDATHVAVNPILFPR